MSDGLTACRACPRLVEWRERVAIERRPAFRQQEYWGRPVPDFGDPQGRLLIVGLAPAAHGANRTGRMFTGDRSGQFLYASLHRTGFANRPDSAAAGDGLELQGCLITAVVHCAPPANQPSREELESCTRWLQPALTRPTIKVILCLGGIAFAQVTKVARRLGWTLPGPASRFGHGVETEFVGGPVLLGSYHPSQQNTFTGRLTPEMMDTVLLRARARLVG